MYDDCILVPKTESSHAQDAYSQLMVLCSDLNVKPEAIERAIERVEHSARAYRESAILKQSKSCHHTGLELESVAKYYRWIHLNLTSVRSNIGG